MAHVEPNTPLTRAFCESFTGGVPAVSSPSESGRSPAAKRFLVNFEPKITLLVTMILKRFAVKYTQTLLTQNDLQVKWMHRQHELEITPA